MFKNNRSLKFSKRVGERYGWFKAFDDVVPFIFSYLDNNEWKIIEEWYKETDEKSLIGEASVPFMSILQGLVMGNSIQRVVQLGHYAGYSTLLLGFMLRKMKKKHSLVTIDIDAFISDFTSSWVKKAGLTDYIKVINSDSTDLESMKVAVKYLQDEPQMVIIDSSHQYQHTKNELNLWYKTLRMGGFLVLHDTSEFSSQYDMTNKGGVYKAFVDWCIEEKIKSSINIFPFGNSAEENTYLDVNGIGIIQKRNF
jgi:predicted O-methyltransferase YrrM